MITCPYCDQEFDDKTYEQRHVPCPEPVGDVRGKVKTTHSGAVVDALEGLASNLATLVSQTVMGGHHGITVMQVLNALNALDKALPFLANTDVPITPDYIKDLRRRAACR
jgi:hypothetical protein